MTKNTAKLTVANLAVSVDGKTVVSGVSFSVAPGEIVALVGPNGSGKSSIAAVLAGHPRYTVTGGTARFGRKNLFALKPEQRARAGVFLAFQSPPSAAGVGVGNFLRIAKAAVSQAKVSRLAFQKQLRETLADLGLAETFAGRDLNEGFSGGEKKRTALLELALLEPKVAILDEIDSGLDADGLRIAAATIKNAASSGTGFLLITHGTRLLAALKPDRVLLLERGRVMKEGSMAVVERIEKYGFAP